MDIALEDLPPLREVIQTFGLDAQKSLGQNFLLDLNITDKIARLAGHSAGNLTGKTVIEVGCGPGGLTRSLLGQSPARVIVIEKDHRCVHALRELVQQLFPEMLQITEGDALKFDYSQFGDDKPIIVANLPYNIATPLLIGWLEQIHTIGGMTLMFQKEVAERIVASPNSKVYGRLSVMSQWLTKAEIVLRLPARAFTPAPKVDSCVVRFTPRTLPPDQQLPFADVEEVVAHLFNQRRKMIKAQLKRWTPDPESFLSQPALAASGILPTFRAEQLNVEQFIILTKIIKYY